MSDLRRLHEEAEALGHLLGVAAVLVLADRRVERAVEAHGAKQRMAGRRSRARRATAPAREARGRTRRPAQPEKAQEEVPRRMRGEAARRGSQAARRGRPGRRTPRSGLRGGESRRKDRAASSTPGANDGILLPHLPPGNTIFRAGDDAPQSTHFEEPPMSAAPLSLEDKYTRESGRVFLSGTQALVRLAMIQRSRDLAAGLQHRGLHLRLSRLPAGRLRPGALEGEEAPRVAPRLLHARRERGARGHRRLGLAAGGALPRREVRRRLRACGTARARAWTAAATSSSTRTRRARRSTAACCSSPATTTPASPRRCRTSRSTRSTRP